MSITDEERQGSADTLRRYFALFGREQIHLADADRAEGGWKRYARCGEWNDDAPDPEVFYPVDADSEQTYTAQGYCLDCPVRVYCDQRATTRGEEGVWGGIYRNQNKRYAVLCSTLGCLRYRAPGKKLCRACQAAAVAKTPGDAPAVAAESIREAAAA